MNQTGQSQYRYIQYTEVLSTPRMGRFPIPLYSVHWGPQHTEYGGILNTAIFSPLRNAAIFSALGSPAHRIWRDSQCYCIECTEVPNPALSVPSSIGLDMYTVIGHHHSLQEVQLSWPSAPVSLRRSTFIDCSHAESMRKCAEWPYSNGSNHTKSLHKIMKIITNVLVTSIDYFLYCRLITQTRWPHSSAAHVPWQILVLFALPLTYLPFQILPVPFGKGVSLLE